MLASATLLVRSRAWLLADVLPVFRVIIHMALEGADMTTGRLPGTVIWTDFIAAGNSSCVVTVGESFIDNNQAGDFVRVVLALDFALVATWQLFVQLDAAI